MIARKLIEEGISISMPTVLARRNTISDELKNTNLSDQLIDWMSNPYHLSFGGIKVGLASIPNEILYRITDPYLLKEDYKAKIEEEKETIASKLCRKIVIMVLGQKIVRRKSSL